MTLWVYQKFMWIKEVISEENLLFYIVRRNPPHKTGEKLCSQALHIREIESKTLILPEVSSLSMIRKMDILLKIYISWHYVYPFLIFFVIENITPNTMTQRALKVSCNVNFFLPYILNLIWMHKKNILKD